MNKLIRKKVILSLIDSDSKFADEIAVEIGETEATVADQVTALIAESICEKTSPDEVSQCVVRKDIETFAQLAKGFLSNAEEHNQETKRFITSEYYLTRIDNQLVDYVLKRFYLDTVYQTDEDKETIRRILLVSPSALCLALHGDTGQFRESRSNWNQLDSSDPTRDWVTRLLHSTFRTVLLEKLIADKDIAAYRALYTELQIRVAKIRIQVGLATPDEKYIEVIGGGSYGFYRTTEGLRPGQLVYPIDFSNDGLAFLHLGEFQRALERFDEALNRAQDPIQKAEVWNNKGVAFLQFGQYQKAIECFEESIVLDSDDEIPILRQNKQIAEEYLAITTDADNLTAPTQIHFIQGQSIPFEETLFYEFKEIKTADPVIRIEEDSDKYAVGFLNRQGGRIFWGIRDSDRITIGVKLDERARDNIRIKVSNKLKTIQPPISPEHWQLEFHNVYDLQREIVEDLWVTELVVPPPQERDVFYTSSSILWVRDEGITRELKGPAATEFIFKHLQDDAETD